ncbi:anti-sigma factor family protein [Catenuloplanes atrovinosus]|uniref:Anti-sigma-YlaC factor YlaD n=1 Tax=Catenuloplanes atrovinosus TaxID=137266 RepID=A0AAE4CCW5_9ACTN|nr:zf-HC2 domain-containing protein [Catenuloplanes atrovinosus]MDR7279687.1 putative anti-sigma-YlaC factor YlaD [Catenuloplanes atrovinosus]
MRCDYAYDDGAYVLGALSPGERAAYERHLSTCSFCREAVAEIAVLPGLLGRLDPADFAELAVPAERSRLPRVITAATTERRRSRRTSRWRYAGTLVAAAALALVVGLGADALRGTGPEGTTPIAEGSASSPSAPPSLTEMKPVAETVPVSAAVGLTTKEYGTAVVMECAYEPTGKEGKAILFRLIAKGADGTEDQIGSWWAAPGDKVELTGLTHYTGDELDRLELIRSDDTSLLTYVID